MRRAAGLSLLFAGVQATTAPTAHPTAATEKQQVNSLPFQAPAFDLQDVSVAFNLRMAEADKATCYNDGGNGLWSRHIFRKAVGQAFNVHAQAVQKVLYANAEEHSQLINTQWSDASYFQLDVNNDMPNPWVPNIYDNIRFDKVVESSYPFFNETAAYNAEQLVSELRDKTIKSRPPTYWNVYVRFTLLNVPTEFVTPTPENPLGFRSFISRLVKSATEGEYTNPVTWAGVPCPGTQIIPSSIWISTEDNFLPDRVEPVKGRGKKDQQLLVPLIMGILFMLLVPFLVVACLVSVAETQNEFDTKIAAKEAEVQKHERTVATLDEKLAIFHQNEQTIIEKEKIKKEEAAAELAYELEEKDIQWSVRQSAPQAKSSGVYE